MFREYSKDLLNKGIEALMLPELKHLCLPEQELALYLLSHFPRREEDLGPKKP